MGSGDATIDGSETGVSFRQALWAMECGFNLHDTMIYMKSSPYPSNVRYNQIFEYMFVLSKDKPNKFNPIKQPKSVNSFSNNKASKTYRSKDGDTEKPNKKALERLKKADEHKFKTADNIWYCKAGYMVGSKDEISFEHPATFPELLAGRHINSWTNKKDLVYDPFMGSGTTAKMAHLLKRNWIGSEISQEYVDLAYKRLEPYLTQQTLF